MTFANFENVLGRVGGVVLLVTGLVTAGAMAVVGA
jgi:hypothetical protein